MTATEVERRWQIMQKLLGPTIGRIQSDLLDPLIERTFNILLRAGELPEMPSVIAENQGELDIEYTGPIPRVQKVELAQSIEQWIQGVIALAEFYPDALDVPDIQAAAREVGVLMGVPAKVMNSKQEALSKKQNREKQQAEAAQAQTAGMEGEAMKSLGDGAQAMGDAGLTAPGGTEGDPAGNVVPINQGQV